ncbi:MULTISPECIES: YggT family protein [Reinekea]|uniref:Integral membrane protein YggT, involved in response to extracytoplasmic stress (Osmotic shock) n=1 Tax=Reinekea forsetii TaxID=1336806 RepID=A0A2K8KKK1_9GAMM|nr:MULTISPECIES: YggT family protein [Reinekea]ATX75500.1 integral membrane protein YggT, involved in response to extracytoplasmic stress (osmotic shock) [Reinekea forsetii]
MIILVMLLRAAFGIVLVSLIARFLAQLARANFYNPLAQTIVKITDPFVKPVRRFVPGLGGMDVSTLLLVYIGQVLFGVVLILLSGQSPMVHLTNLLLWGLVATPALILTVIQFSMIIVGVMSFVLMGQRNPFVDFIGEMIEPFVGPFRRMNLKIGMLDLSFMLAFFVIIILKDVVLMQYVGGLLGYPVGVFIGL